MDKDLERLTAEWRKVHRSGDDKEDYELSKKIYEKEMSLPNKEFISRLVKGQLHICQEIKWWRQRYGLNKAVNVSRELVAILDGHVDYEDQGLSDKQKKEVKERLQETLSLPFGELMELIKSEEL